MHIIKESHGLLLSAFVVCIFTTAVSSVKELSIDAVEGRATHIAKGCGQLRTVSLICSGIDVLVDFNYYTDPEMKDET